MESIKGERSIFHACLCKKADKHWQGLFYRQLQWPPCTVSQRGAPTLGTRLASIATLRCSFWLFLTRITILKPKWYTCLSSCDGIWWLLSFLNTACRVQCILSYPNIFSRGRLEKCSDQWICSDKWNSPVSAIFFEDLSRFCNCSQSSSSVVLRIGSICSHELI